MTYFDDDIRFALIHVFANQKKSKEDFSLKINK